MSSNQESGKPWRDPQTLRRLYHGEEKSIREVAESLGCSRHAVDKWMDRYGIEKRNMSDAVSVADRDLSKVESEREEWQNEEKLRDLYIENQMSTVQIAEEYDCAASTVSKWLDKLGIEARPIGTTVGKVGERSQIPPSVRTNTTGYVRVETKRDGVRRTVALHKIQATLKVDDIEELDDAVIHHKNAIRFDNRLSNLEVMQEEDHYETIERLPGRADGKALCRECENVQYFLDEPPQFCGQCGAEYDNEEITDADYIDWSIGPDLSYR